MSAKYQATSRLNKMQPPGTGSDEPARLRTLVRRSFDIVLVECSDAEVLGLAEQYSTARSYLGIYNNVCVTATYSNRHGRELRAALFSSLSALIRKHPILSAVPIDIPASTTHFVRLQQIELDKVVTFIGKPIQFPPKDTTDALLDDIIMNEHNLPFKHKDTSIPYWRITVFADPPGFIIIYTLSMLTPLPCGHAKRRRPP
ncbi:hypothetical protein FSARC_10366 [Fusarium sarcochroum]|uniref:Uncharacterized protein n=1 Tax=Fusarium sarcochroum TaxID=1208366 RepID=A0A8H4X4M2_9HYPO|nr:hypothetical protein FSARC_10366 [Fusarium sarcochroum]